jgi:hypothetical protein
MEGLTFRRSLVSRAANWLLLIPFGMAGAALFLKASRLDVFLFIGGLGAVVTLILVNNLRTYIRIGKDRLYLSLPYSSYPEEHPFDLLLGYKIKGRRRLFLYSFEHRPVRVVLDTRDRNTLVKILQENNIYEAEKVF